MITKLMLIQDVIYGNCEIPEPVLLDLIESPTLKRLQDIDQAGYSQTFFPARLTRFEHSVGVCLLLRRYNNSIDEQIAGLIHDVSHSAFSHCIDYILDRGTEHEQSHQDNVFEEYVRNSDIPQILQRHGVNVDYILDDSNFPLKERALPDICADRIDYTLRVGVLFKELKNPQEILDTLTINQKSWVFKNYESAKKFADLFYVLNKKYFSGIQSACMFHAVGGYLRHALANNYITEKDLYTTDAQVLSRIKPHHANDKKLSLLFDRMSGKISFSNDPHNFEREIICKSRVIDPLCWHQGKIQRVSDIDFSWKEILIAEAQPKRYFLKFEH